MFRSKLLYCVLAAVVFLTGCERYQQHPLDSTAIIQSVDAVRRGPVIDAGSARKPLTFSAAAELAAIHSPALRDALAEYRSALALACVKTPLPNPSVEVGPRFGFGPDVIRRRVEPFGSIGFAIPTGKRLKRQDELNRINAEMANVEYVAKHRETYLALRKAYAELTLSRLRLTTRKSILESAAKTSMLNKKQVENGQITALDVVLFELDAGRMKGESLDANFDIANAESTLAELVGLNWEALGALPENSLPQPPTTIPPPVELKKILAANHTDLARLRVKYEAAEAQLRLEIAKQYPDFKFGTSGEGDINDRKTLIGLTLGIDVPIFDRNQQAIAAAKGKREELRTKYEAAANRALASLDRAVRAVQLASEKLEFLRNELLPLAKQSLELTQKSVDIGASDSFRLLENQRAQRTVTLSVVDAELVFRRAWVDLEQAVGYPLMLFPEEPKGAMPALPDLGNACILPSNLIAPPVEAQK